MEENNNKANKKEIFVSWIGQKVENGNQDAVKIVGSLLSHSIFQIENF